mmetsp:Transcript_14936/g.59931  ORF Transcript_14936/g.59931 Transcript_14936/m.59931 type:complete len:374 (+) Transcript_14936:1183-2304(+)
MTTRRPRECASLTLRSSTSVLSATAAQGSVRGLLGEVEGGARSLGDLDLVLAERFERAIPRPGAARERLVVAATVCDGEERALRRVVGRVESFRRAAPAQPRRRHGDDGRGGRRRRRRPLVRSAGRHARRQRRRLRPRRVGPPERHRRSRCRAAPRGLGLLRVVIGARRSSATSTTVRGRRRAVEDVVVVVGVVEVVARGRRGALGERLAARERPPQPQAQGVGPVRRPGVRRRRRSRGIGGGGVVKRLRHAELVPGVGGLARDGEVALRGAQRAAADALHLERQEGEREDGRDVGAVDEHREEGDLDEAVAVLGLDRRVEAREAEHEARIHERREDRRRERDARERRGQVARRAQSHRDARERADEERDDDI